MKPSTHLNLRPFLLFALGIWFRFTGRRIGPLTKPIVVAANVFLHSVSFKGDRAGNDVVQEFAVMAYQQQRSRVFD